MNLKDRSFIQKAFDITRENLILTQPLILFMIVLSFTLAGLSMQTSNVRFVVFLAANVLLSCAFAAGWFFMIKQGIYLNKRIENGEFRKKEERAEASLALGKAFFPGVGESFWAMTFTVLFYALIGGALMFAFYKLGVKFLPAANIDWKQLYSLSNAAPAEIQKYILSLSFEQLKAINIWMMYALSVLGGFSFLTMFLYPALMEADPKENVFFAPFKAFLQNLKFLLKNICGSMGIMIYLLVLNMILSVLSVIFNLNIILSVVGLIATLYFMTYAVVLIFLYYEDRK